MSFRSLASSRYALPLAAILVLSACTDNNRAVPLSGLEPIDIPAADVDKQANTNIDTPTLTVPQTYEVTDGDLLTLVWSDEFNGAQLDPEVWFYETGDGSQYGFGQNGVTPGWGNNELQYYLPDSVQLANGALQITARRETAEGYNFTSGRIATKDRFAFKYGRIEASIKLPSGQGLWSAFWMLSQDSPYGVWAQTGEIDIAEAINLDGTGGNEIFSTIHFGGDAALGQNTSSETRYTPSFDVTEDFHTYAFEWDEFEMRWYVDGTLYAVENSWSSTGGPYPAPFDQPFYVLFNLAVGGDFPGSPDGSTPFPATLEVDWVRVYSGEDTYVPADRGTVPDIIIYSSDPNVVPDLILGVDFLNFDRFGSGSEFATVTSDRDFQQAFAVTTGDGYTVQVGQLGLTGFVAGFATGYDRLEFKIKNINNDLIRLKFNPDGAYLDITLTSSSYATALGNGWYQVSVPIADFTGVDTATALLFETDNTAANPFTFLLTDIGFSGTAGGGGGGGDTVLATFDEAVPPAVTAFGNSIATIEAGPAGGNGNALKIDRNNGEVYAGAWIAISPIPSDAGAQTVSARVYSPVADIRMVAKTEYGENMGTGDTDANETVVVGWQTLTWTFNGLDPSQSYNRFTMLPNLPNADDLDYFYDDITLLASSGGGGGGGDGNFVNGDFETGDFTGWTLTQVPAGRGSIALDTSGQGGRAGTVARLVAAGDATSFNDVLISQEALGAGTVAPGDSINVSFDLFGSLTGAGGVVFVEVVFLDGAGQDVGGRNFVGPPAPYTPTGTWTTHSGTVIAGTGAGGVTGYDVSGGVTLLLKAACGQIPDGCGVDASFDNVTFTIN